MEASQRDEVEAWKKNPWDKLPRWAKWTIGVVAAFILLGIGAAVGSSEEDDIKAELAEAQAELIDAEEERDKAVAEADGVLDRKEEILGQAKSEAAAVSAELKDLRGEVDATESDLADAESSLAGAEREEALSSFGDGVWQAEVDFVPGTYRASGGEGCYWEKLSTAGGEFDDIIANGGFEENQILTIDSPYFSTSDCGTWERVE